MPANTRVRRTECEVCPLISGQKLSRSEGRHPIRWAVPADCTMRVMTGIHPFLPDMVWHTLGCSHVTCWDNLVFVYITVKLRYDEISISDRDGIFSFGNTSRRPPDIHPTACSIRTSDFFYRKCIWWLKFTFVPTSFFAFMAWYLGVEQNSLYKSQPT